MEKKLFEEREYTDGGPNDKGKVIGYHFGISNSQLRKKYRVTHGFIQFFPITFQEYAKRKREAEKALAIFNIK